MSSINGDNSSILFGGINVFGFIYTYFYTAREKITGYIRETTGYWSEQERQLLATVMNKKLLATVVNKSGKDCT